MTETARRLKLVGRWALGTVVAPILLMSTYLVLSRQFGGPSDTRGDWIAIVACAILGGIAFVRAARRSSWSVLAQAGGCLLYLPILAGGLVLWSFHLVCAAFGDCL